MRGVACATALFMLGFVSRAGVTHAQGNLRAPSRDQVMGDVELVPLLFHSGTESRLSEVEDRLVPIWSALPKNASGYVCHPVARYALVSYFLVYRGWYVKGLSRTGGVWNEFPADSTVESDFPQMVLLFIDGILNKPLISIKDLVQVVTAVETLEYSNVKDILTLAYDALYLPIDQPIQDADQEPLVLNIYAAFLFQPDIQLKIAEQSAEEFMAELRDIQPFYADIDTLVRDTLQEAKRASANPFVKSMDFASMLAIADVISSDMGKYQQTDCLDMKHTLMDIERTENGRLSLANFYRPLEDGDRWLFNESPKYLEFVGALDASIPRHDHVLIPNYVSSMGNCLLTSTFHQVCCINECEALMTNLEDSVRKPYGRPAEILDAVAMLPSDTVHAPRNLSDTLRNRLFDISRMHDGTVPLHGRMFSEWMHRAFPNECPMPVEKRSQKTEFKEEDKLATTQEMEDIISKDPTNNTDYNDFGALSLDSVGDELEMPWSEVEELLADQDWTALVATDKDKATTRGRSSSARDCLRFLAVISLVAFAVKFLLPTALSLLAASLGTMPKDKFLLP